MIRSNEKGEVIVVIDNASYNLAINDEYVEFLLKITSPDESVVFDEGAFSVDAQSFPEHEDKLRRYSEFLNRFSKIRSEEIAAAQTQSLLTKRDLEISAFVEALKKA